MIDFTSGGIFAAILGDDSPVIRKAMRQTKVFCSYAPHRQDYWRDRYIAMLKRFTGFESVALFSTGSEATEAFWRCCRVYNGKPGIWGGLIDPDEVGTDTPKCDAMHGVTLGAMIMAGRMSWHELGIYPELGEGRFGKGHEMTSCMIMEPYHAPSAQFHKPKTIDRILSLQKEFVDIPLCVDEIQGGFGRTGKLWAHEHYDGLKPQFVTIGKGCGGGMPLSALLGPKEIMESDSVKTFGHLHSTHSGNPVMCAVGCAVIEEIEKEDLIKESERKGVILHDALQTFPVKTHGKGLLAGLVMQDEAEVVRVTQRCKESGLFVVDTGRKWVKIGPPLNIEDEDLEAGIAILKQVVEEVILERKTEAPGDSGQGSDEGVPVLPEVGVQDSSEE
jgi:acetylornithine/succinyldiaminopimelate/putrescine aminotransferase